MPERAGRPPPSGSPRGTAPRTTSSSCATSTATLDIDPERVARLCDRRAGIGADGLIRVVRSAACPDAARRPRARTRAPSGSWTTATPTARPPRCAATGSGSSSPTSIREQLIDLALLDADGPGLPVASRAGVKRVRRREDGWFAVDMGGWRFVGGDDAVVAGYDATVHVHGLDVARPALRLDLGNPHTVAMLSDLDELAALDLTRAPGVDPEPADGTNVELLVALDPEQAGDELVGRLAMRVHERGVGETRSCGTGCVRGSARRARLGRCRCAGRLAGRRPRRSGRGAGAARRPGRAERAGRPRRGRHDHALTSSL